MPTYEYQCTACGHQLEAFQKMSEVPLTDCPACHQSTLSKQVSAAGFQLKGSGWYKTDYSKKSTPKTEEKPAAAASETKVSDTKATPASQPKDTSSNSGAASS